MNKEPRQYPLGQTVPNSVHAVCASLPTIDDVVGYEERRKSVMDCVKYAYPRFVFHDYILRVTEAIRVRNEMEGRLLYAVSSHQAVLELTEYVGVENFSFFPEAGFFIVSFPDTPTVRERAKSFLQHTGVSISSRQAEDWLWEEGQLTSRQEETLYTGDGLYAVKMALAQYLDTPYIHVTNCGMNSLYAAIKATRKIQRPKGRTLYLQLGWLYLDTQKILQRLLGPDEEVVTILDVFDRDRLEQFFRTEGHRLAAVVTELPTNPLVQTPDVEWLSQQAKDCGAVRIFDPSISGVANVDILPHSDILVASLTKYAASAGDIMIGLLAVNADSPFQSELEPLLKTAYEAPYIRDLQRLACEIQDMALVVDKINTNTRAMVAWLEKHPAVKKVHWAMDERSGPHYRKIARSEGCCGGIVTIELNGDLATFYDRALVVKGPSFGTVFTMMCPFLYLAHYDMVTNPEGREFLIQNGLNPELVRISFGTEPLEFIQRALSAGLDAGA